MTDDWMKRKADEARRARQESLASAEKRKQDANKTKKLAPEAWKALVSAAEEKKKHFNEEFANDADFTIDHFDVEPPSKLEIRRTRYPAVSVKAYLSPDDQYISYEVRRQTSEWSGTLSFHRDEKGNIVFHGSRSSLEAVGPTEAAQNLIEPFFEVS